MVWDGQAWWGVAWGLLEDPWGFLGIPLGSLGIPESLGVPWGLPGDSLGIP